MRTSKSKNSKSNKNSRQSKVQKQSKKSSECPSSLDNMKYEIANEFGVKLGAESSAKANGSVGGEMTRRLVQMAHSKSNNKKSR